MEEMDVVDKVNNVIGSSTRQEIHKSDMWHRGIHVFIFNESGELLLSVRSATKDKFPNTFDCSVSEHVKKGENYEDAALRGIYEELSIKPQNIETLLLFRMKYGEHDNMISKLFKCSYSGEMELDKNEVKEAQFFSMNKIKTMVQNSPEKFSPWTLELLKQYLGTPSRIEELG